MIDQVKVSELRNTLMQLRKTCNHPDLILSEGDQNAHYPPLATMLKQGGKLQLLDRIISSLLDIPVPTHKRRKRVEAGEVRAALPLPYCASLDALFFFQKKKESACKTDYNARVPYHVAEPQGFDFQPNDARPRFFGILSRAKGDIACQARWDNGSRGQSIGYSRL